MYVSKHFTCPEIDQRLKQGYYDDFVSAGFVGTLQEFWAFVLSIKDKPGTEAVQGLLDSLETKLKGLIGEVQTELGKTDQVLDAKIDQSVTELEGKLEAQKVTRVSQLENDSKYQTEEQVKAYISALVNGANESLDTLLELAEALGNDPNFAATITEKLGQLKAALEAETARAKEKETELQEALTLETSKREEGDANVLKLTEQHVDQLAKSIQASYNNLDGKIVAINQSFQALQTSFQGLSTELNQKVKEAKSEAKADNDALKTEIQANIQEVSATLDKKISDETTRATGAEQTLDTRVSELDEKVSGNTSAIQKEVADRAAGDLNLEKKILGESTVRAEGDTALQDKLSQETINRITGDSDLQEKLTNEISERKAADTEIKSELTLEKTTRETADTSLSRDIEQLETKHQNDISTLTQDLATEVARAKQVEGGKVDKQEGYGLSKNDLTDALLEKLNAIQDQANYITKVSELINDSGFQTEDQVNAAIQAIVGSAPEVLDTLQEISEALGNDPNFAGTMLNRLASLSTQLNEEISNRTSADEALKLELLGKIKEATDSLGNNYALLEERLNSYKASADSQNTATNTRIDALEKKVEDKVAYFLEKVTELSDKYSEKVNELTTKVNQFTTDIMARINAQDDLIQGNAANIQKNLDLIQNLTGEVTSIKATETQNFNQLLTAIKEEADTRKAADDLLTQKVDANTREITKTATSLEELDQYVKDNLLSITGSSTIDAAVGENSEGKPETVISVKLPENEEILSKEPTGLKTNLGIKKTQTDTGLVHYNLTGKGNIPLLGVEPIEIPEVNPFTEVESTALYNSIYGA